MGKHIVILNGSPRLKGNTAALCQAFTEGAESAGHTVITFLLDTMNIHGCKGCYGGGKNPASPCVQKDDMDQIYPIYKEADIVVLASPLYFWNINGQLKCALDRLYAVAESYDNWQNLKKDCVLLMAGGSDEYDESLQYYDGLLRRLGWRSLGHVLAKDVINIGDINGKPELGEARKLGASLN